MPAKVSLVAVVRDAGVDIAVVHEHLDPRDEAVVGRHERCHVGSVVEGRHNLIQVWPHDASGVSGG